MEDERMLNKVPNKNDLKNKCETRGKYASKESHAFEAYCDVHMALKASPCGLAISGNNRLSL
jgi:hypothetical protein